MGRRKPGRKDWSQCMPDGKGWILILCVRSLVGLRKKISAESRGNDYSERDRYGRQEIS